MRLSCVLLLLSACAGTPAPEGSPASSPAPVGDPPPETPNEDTPAPECQTADDCHYDDPCMAETCTAAPTPDHECTESRRPDGPCVCLEGRCAMGPPEPAPEPPECTTDASCYFDDPCVPTACSTTPPGEVACEETGPPPGTCRCRAGACVMQRPDERSVRACRSGHCGFRIADGTCEPERDNEPVHNAPGESYPVCHCGGPGPVTRCNLGWVEPVPCESVNDCWIEWGPRGPVPIRRPRRFRGRAFRPCADGRIDPVCRDGYCVVDPQFTLAC